MLGGKKQSWCRNGLLLCTRKTLLSDTSRNSWSSKSYLVKLSQMKFLLKSVYKISSLVRYDSKIIVKYVASLNLSQICSNISVSVSSFPFGLVSNKLSSCISFKPISSVFHSGICTVISFIHSSFYQFWIPAQFWRNI